MDFSLDQIAVPFRMQPGLRRLEAGEPQLTSLRPGSALHADKLSVLQAGLSRHAVPGFDPGPAMESIAARAQLERFAGTFSSEVSLELAFEEDFAVLDGATATVPWLCVCVPSHWAPEDKLGQSLAAIHGPVADNALLQAATTQLVQLATGGGRWERFVWTLTPSPLYDQHPLRHPRTQWPDAADAQEFAARTFLRAERQTFFPVGRGTQQAVFTIRVMLHPLAQAVAGPAQAQRLHDSLASMSDAVLAYKNITPARDPLLRWLKTRIS
ncbi:MAG: DUF3445 domain-containing protein [Burkholderiales bacterium]|nr:DUF3445 domain-containing protein [Burkholderiales bacterium]